MPARLLRHPARMRPLLIVTTFVFAPLLSGEGVLADEPVLTRDAQSLLSQRLHRLARHVLAESGTEAELPADALVRAAALQELAFEQREEDEWGWRRRRELAAIARDDAMRLEALRQIVRLDPDDDAAQLEVILMQVTKIETVDGRLERLERLLRSESARRLTPGLRSRLASHAARLADEIGDETRFARWLTQATRLDESNAEAAELLWRLTLERSSSTLQRASAAMSLIRAAPLRVEPRLAVATMLADAGAYAEASGQFAVCAELASRSALGPRSLRQWAFSLAAMRSDARAMELLTSIQRDLVSDELRDASAEVRATQAAASNTNMDTGSGDGEGAGSDNASAGDGSAEGPDFAAIESLARDRMAALDPQLTVLEAVLAEPTSPRRVEAARRLAEAVSGDTSAEGADDAEAVAAERTRLAAVLGEDFITVLDRAAAEAVSRSPLVRAFEAWRADETAAARRLVLPMVQEGNEPLATFLAAATLSNEADANHAVKRLVVTEPNTLAALLAARWLVDEDEDVPLTSRGESLQSMMREYPSAIWRMDIRSSPWIDLRLSSGEAGGPFDPWFVTAELRNLTNLRWSFDAGSPLPTTAVMRTTLNPGGRASRTLEPDVIDIRRRLVLEPESTMQLRLPMHRGAWGEAVRSQVFNAFYMRSTMLLDPRTLRDGRVVMGPLGDRDDVQGVVSRNLSADPESLQAMLDRLGGRLDASSLEAVSGLIAALKLDEGESAPAPELRDEIVEALGAYAAETGEAALVWMLTELEAGEDLGLSRVFDLARRSESAPVRMVMLEVHVDTADDPLLTAALRAGGAKVQRYANAVRDAIERRNGGQDDASGE